MTFEQAAVVGVSITLAVLALTGAVMAWRMLARTGRRLRVLDERLVLRTEAIPRQAAAFRERLVSVRGESERALWSLSNLDARLDAARTGMADKRAASDRLRASMAHNRALLQRIRSGARTLLRVIQMRREFLG